MTRKTSRRKRRPNIPQYQIPTESSEDIVETGEKPLATASVSSAKTRIGSVAAPAKGLDSINWPAEYPHVVSDLRNMAIVAALMLALLVGLNFLI